MTRRATDLVASGTFNSRQAPNGISDDGSRPPEGDAACAQYGAPPPPPAGRHRGLGGWRIDLALAGGCHRDPAGCRVAPAVAAPACRPGGGHRRDAATLG